MSLRRKSAVVYLSTISGRPIDINAQSVATLFGIGMLMSSKKYSENILTTFPVYGDAWTKISADRLISNTTENSSAQSSITNHPSIRCINVSNLFMLCTVIVVFLSKAKCPKEWNTRMLHRSLKLVLTKTRLSVFGTF